MQPENNGDLTPGQVDRQVEEIVSAADRLGVEMDRHEAEQWILAVSRAEHEQAVAQDPETGVFGHRISLLDFDAEELAAFRALAQRLRMARRPNVESAIAIAGSAAQGKVQPFPGDNDFFERLNIKAAAMDEARATIRELMHETAERAFADPDVVLIEVVFGVYPLDVRAHGRPRKKGDSITWGPTDILHGCITVEDEAGKPVTLQWNDVPTGTGYYFFSWIVADRAAGRIVFASNMLDVTWESPDGEIVPLDGSLDPFFQEIYLEPEALPIFNKIVRHLDPGATSAYINAMRQQVWHYLHEKPNLGKVTKRLYNLCRLTNQLEQAAYLRELFDEPGAEIYQIPSLLEAADIAMGEEDRLGRETVVSQIERVAEAARDGVMGQPEEELLDHLARLKSQVAAEPRDAEQWKRLTDEVNDRCLELVNNYFHDKLYGFPPIAETLDKLQA